jgi:predicted ATPase
MPPNQKYKSLSDPLEWDNIPNLAILTGINGSGKSQLLEFIYNNSQNGTALDVKLLQEDIHFSDSDKLKSTVRSNLESQQESHIKNIITILDPVRRSQVMHQVHQQKYIETITDIAKSINKNINNLTEQDIIDNIPFGFFDSLKDNSDFIAYFKTYLNNKSKRAMQLFNNKNEFKKISSEYEKIHDELAPWDIINNLFIKYNFDYRLKALEDVKNINDILFISEKSNIEIPFNALSSGEQMIAKMVMWSHNPHTAKRVKLMLLDEADAHLHPSLSKLYINILKDLTSYGVNIIATTHSPSTVSASDDESVFVMNKESPRIEKQSKEDAIRILSDGQITFNHGLGLLELGVKSNKSTIIFTEGKTDVNHLKQALSKLKLDLDVDIFNCECADQLKQFLNGAPESLFNGKKVIGLFDYDDEGIKSVKGFNKTENELVSKVKAKKSFYSLLLTPPNDSLKKYENCFIEYLYTKDILDKYDLIEKMKQSEFNSLLNKSGNSKDIDSIKLDDINDLWTHKVKNNLKTRFAEEYINELNITDFENFKPIFDNISDIILNKY